jgi:hypothetical protein
VSYYCSEVHAPTEDKTDDVKGTQRWILIVPGKRLERI